MKECATGIIIVIVIAVIILIVIPTVIIKIVIIVIVIINIAKLINNLFVIFIVNLQQPQGCLRSPC